MCHFQEMFCAARGLLCSTLRLLLSQSIIMIAVCNIYVFSCANSQQ